MKAELQTEILCKTHFEFIELKNYKYGYCLASPVVNSLEDYSTTKAVILGYYISFGSVNYKCDTLFFDLPNNKKFVYRRIKYYFTCLGVKVKSFKRIHKGKKTITIVVYDPEFCEECVKLCGQKVKRLHSDVFGWSSSAKIAILKGISSFNSTISTKKKFRWVSASRDMIEDLKFIFMSLGVDAFAVKINHRKGMQPKYEIYTLTTFVNQVECEYFPRIVEGIKDGEKKKVYDIVLSDKSHSFVAGGVSVSNCELFKYHGFKFKAWREGYGLQPETRRPSRNNTSLRGYVCHHLYHALFIYPLLSRQIELKFKNKFNEL